MFNLFEAIEGQRSEDLTTEVLAYVLQSPRFHNEQKLFFAMLLKDGELKSTLDRSFEINTQVYDVKLGKPDLEIRGEDLLILIENKFEAEFSQGTQVWRYVEILKKESTIPKRKLVLLCPNYSLNWYQSKASKQFEPNLPIEDRCKELAKEGISLVFLSWEKLLQTLGTQSPLIADLNGFVDSRYLKNIQFSESEIKLMFSKSVPVLLEKIEDTVNKVKGQLSSEGVTVERTGQSRFFYGFHLLGDKGLKAWFGYHRPSWAKEGTPFILQVRKEWSEKAEAIPLADFLREGWVHDVAHTRIN
ncbi:MAG: PD-(D/E)XK nuclease family protein [Planctomycetota bacterium]|nr:PD-(D/E)XK nuclease family protein [Planctomycetota bacterium]